MAQILIITSKKYIKNRHSKKGIINRYNSNSNNRLLKLIRLKRNGIQNNKNKHTNRSYMESPKVEFSNIIIQEVPDENTGFAKPYFYNGSFSSSSSSSSTLDEDAYGGLNDINNIISSNNNTLDTSGGLEVEVAECIVLTPGEEILHRAELQEYINSQRDHTVFAMVECDSELERSDSGFLQSSNFDPNSGSTSNFNSFEDLGSLPVGGGGRGGGGGGGSSRGAGFSGYFVEEPELIQHRGTESEYFGNNPVGYTYSSYQVEEVVDDDDISENDIDMF